MQAVQRTSAFLRGVYKAFTCFGKLLHIVRVAELDEEHQLPEPWSLQVVKWLPAPKAMLDLVQQAA